MKKIFRYTNIGLLLTALFAVSAVANYAQDACADADALKAADEKFRAALPDKTIPGREKTISAAKEFLEKYGACEAGKELGDYLKGQIPKFEATLKTMREAAVKDALVKRFDDSLKNKAWDEVYASGKEILQKYPEDFRTVEIVLASLAGEEAFKGNFKYADEGLRFAKQSISDLEGGKAFLVGKETRYGLALKDVYNFAYATKEEAIGWMNLYVGYIMQVNKKDKTGAAPFLYKASQSTADVGKNPIPFELIGGFYFDELNKVVEQIQTKAKDQKDTDAPDVAQKKVDEIKALVGLSNGISERAMDAFSRAYTLGKDPAYKAKMKKNVQDAYKVRFAKEDGVDQWIATAVAKPFVNPSTPVAPISDPDPVTTTTTSTTPPATAPIKPGTAPAPAAATKPVGATAIKPGTTNQ